MKAFFSFFFGGDATRDLNEVVGVEQSAKLSLYTTKTLSLSEYIEKCVSTFGISTVSSVFRCIIVNIN